jgi:LAS superfamily LD-carboxypeptidase LdcB
MNQQLDYLMLINEDHAMPENFETIVDLIPVVNAIGEQFQIDPKTYEAFLRLREDVLKNDGIQAELISVYRTYEYQANSFARYLREFGPEYANTYVAKPGCSEHHTGFAIDVGILLDGKLYRSIEELLRIDHLFQPIQAKFPKYGFILRYPRGKEAITKIGYEPWHFRYLDSPEIAQEITAKGICFEEYKNTP